MRAFQIPWLANISTSNLCLAAQNDAAQINHNRVDDESKSSVLMQINAFLLEVTVEKRDPHVNHGNSALQLSVNLLCLAPVGLLVFRRV
jgi:hypothetical protein